VGIVKVCASFVASAGGEAEMLSGNPRDTLLETLQERWRSNEKLAESVARRRRERKARECLGQVSPAR
jgi:hypothetical protein